jgi:outer membrane protein
LLPSDVKVGEELQVVTISAAEAGRIAIDKSPSLRLARALVLSAHGLTIEARSGLLPNLGLSSSGTEIDNIRTSGSGGSSNSNSGTNNSQNSSLSAQLTLSQLLFDFGHTLALAQQALANEKAAIHRLTRSEQSLESQTKVAYYLFALNTEMVGVELENVKDRKAQEDLAQARVTAGPGEPSDLLVAQTNLAEAIQLLVVARNAALTTRIALATTMGIDPRTPIAPSNSTESTVASSFSDSYRQALGARPDLLQSLQQLSAAGYEVRAATTNDSPVLNLVAGYQGDGARSFGSNQTASIGLTLNWAIFDGFNTRGRKIAAQADLETARASLLGLQQTIGSDVATAWSNVQFAVQRLPLVQGEKNIATESLRIAEGRYKAGIGAFINVTDAEAALLTAKQAVLSAQNSLATAWVSLRFAIGAR